MNELKEWILVRKKIVLGVAILVGAGVVVGGLYAKKGITPGPDSPKEARANSAPQKKAVYTCPMHPGITSDHPDNCPICHMALQRVDEDEAPQPQPAANTAGDHAQMGHGTSVGSGTEKSPAADPHAEHTAVPGRSEFNLSQEKQQLIGVTTTQVEPRVLGSEIRATGRVAFDPDLYTAVEEYRQALISRGQMRDQPYEGLLEQSNELVASARTKLKLMGLTDDQIRALSAGKSSALSLILPKGKVWVYAEIFEYEMAFVKVGQKIEAIAPSYPGKTFTGTVTSVSPLLNAPTRTVRVLAQVPDPQLLLRPDTFLNVKIKVEAGEVLSVPQDAVLHSGDRAFVFVVKEKGKFQPRAVSIGRRLGEYYEILSGLSAGERVVTAANFLIDSESRLRSALKNMESGGGAPASPPGHEGHGGGAKK